MAFLEDASTGTRWVLAGIALALTVGATFLFRRLSPTKVVPGSPGYDAFQKAGSAAAQRQARAAWGPQGLAAARKAWTLDLAYPVLYSLFGALAFSLASSYAEWDWLDTATAVLSWLVIAAGAADLLVENPAVALGLWREPTDAAARVAKSAGDVKRGLLAIALVAMPAALVAVLVSRA